MIALAVALALAAPRAAAAPAAAPPPTHVDADRVEYLYKERRTVMTGNPVVMTRDDARLFCKKLVADNDEAGEIRHAICEGDVKLTRGEKIVTCARATYDGQTSTVTCRGDPVLRDGPSIMRGEELVYDLDRDRVLLTHAVKGTLVQRPGEALPVKKKEKEKSR